VALSEIPSAVPVGRPLTLPGRGTTWVRESGVGAPGSPALVLLHGWTVTAALNWVHAFEPLAAGFRVVALDHRGHGRGISPSRVRRFRFDDCADDVVALADALGIERVVPVGYSMGGPVAALTWRRHPSRVAGLVLCATSRHFASAAGARPAGVGLAVRGGALGVAAALRSAPPAVRQRASAAMLERRAAGLPEWALAEVSCNDPAAIVEAFAELRAFDAAPWIGDIDVPTAVLVTTQDRIVPPARQRALADDIPGAAVWEVEGDHTACVSDPEAFVPALVEACRWVAARAA
jgi:3-oxoadipate enol-lactonase